MIKYLSAQHLKKFAGKTCLLRVDLNVEEGVPLDSYRLEAVLPTIKLLLKNNVKVVLLSHRGRPTPAKRRIPNSKFQIPKQDRKLSLRPFAQIFAKKINHPVTFLGGIMYYTTDFKEIREKIRASRSGSVFILENLRFVPGEDKNDDKLAKRIAALGDFYVNDAFAVSHRANASVAAITKFLPSYAGLSMEQELKNLGGIFKHTTHPFTIIIGGAKVSDKLGVMKNFWSAGRRKADNFLIGGGPANTFLRAEGMNVIDSLVDNAALPLIKPYLNSKKVHLPSDLKWDKTAILDIGPKTVKEYAAVIKRSRVIIWNGPMGWFERRGFGGGTKGVWQAVLANKKARTVIGGGETVASAKLISNFKFQISNLRNVFISTGGGAMLDYLSGKKLPGIAALEKNVILFKRASLAKSGSH
jgi:phosphoglycerate kinase